MNKLTPRRSFLMAFLPSLVLLSACARTGATQSGAPPDIQTVANIDASGDAYVYYSLRENRPVETEDGAWDIAFQNTNIRVNGSVQLVETPFEAVVTAPEDGYQRDEAARAAIPGGSGNGWYLYDSGSHKIMPIPGRTLILKTAAETYAKLEILSYYFMDLPSGSDEGGDPRYYTFRFAHQTDGSRVLGGAEMK